MIRASAYAVVLAGTVVFAAGCAKKPEAKNPLPEVITTSADVPRAVNVDAELMKACAIRFDNVARAPKFDFDDYELLPADRDVLAQVAKCVTTGPLAGKKLALVGRADPRGTTEYNMVLGENRSGTVSSYLEHLGVGKDVMTSTSRGELDSDGVDELTWAKDRRVDILLLK
jgi:peptidoglycan-associated lipoprotein